MDRVHTRCQVRQYWFTLQSGVGSKSKPGIFMDHRCGSLSNSLSQTLHNRTNRLRFIRAAPNEGPHLRRGSVAYWFETKLQALASTSTFRERFGWSSLFQQAGASL